MTATAASPCPRSARLRAHQPLVQRVAARLHSRLPAHVEMDDLLQSGLIGLDDALSRYEPRDGASFETYATRRIQGAMLDALRQLDTMPRDARARHRRVRQAVQRLEHRLGRAPRAQEVANELDWSLSQFHDCMAEFGVGALRSDDGEGALNDLTPALGDEVDRPDPLDEEADPLRAIQQRQRHAALNRAFDALEAHERLVMELIYDRGAPLREVGVALGVSAPRVCQIHERIVTKLRRRLRDW
ncbi:MAG TPA: FliA/WhiG family RNA polymerase sigma factor [Methylibium sp.]|nr:FliA/WhiG family RNA polymerase sigma factor [Methylibium sp.]